MAQIQAAFQVCLAVTGPQAMVSFTVLAKAGYGGVRHPLALGRGTVTWQAIGNLLAEATLCNQTAFLFVAFGMPSERFVVIRRHSGRHSQKKKPRCRTDNRAFPFNDEVRSGPLAKSKKSCVFGPKSSKIERFFTNSATFPRFLMMEIDLCVDIRRHSGRHSQKKFHGHILHTQAPRRFGADLCEDHREAWNAIQVLHGLGVALERAMGQSARSHWYKPKNRPQNDKRSTGQNG